VFIRKGESGVVSRNHQAPDQEVFIIAWHGAAMWIMKITLQFFH